MAERSDRILMRKRIKNPNDETQYVDIPVIYQMRFQSMVDQAQEFWLYLDNSRTASRRTHIYRVMNINDPNAWVDVERIDAFVVKTMQEQGQDCEFYLKNTDPPPKLPTGENNPAHEKVHYVRYYKDNDTNSEAWIDCELIDELKFHDAVSRHQDWIWYFRHADIGDPVDDETDPYSPTIGYCDPSLPLAPDESGGFPEIDPPYRTDICTNIVNVSWEPTSSQTRPWLILTDFYWKMAQLNPDWSPPRWGWVWEYNYYNLMPTGTTPLGTVQINYDDYLTWKNELVTNGSAHTWAADTTICPELAEFEVQPPTDPEDFWNSPIVEVEWTFGTGGPTV